MGLIRGRLVLCLVCLLLLIGCSINKMAVRQTAAILEQASIEMETEKNWNLFKDALPANIKMIEGMLSIDPQNEKLLLGLIKAYSAYGFGVNETLLLEDKLVDVDDSIHRQQAISNYTKALTYGFRYLSKLGISFEAITEQQDNNVIKKLINEKVGNDRDLEAVFFTAQAWGSLINLQRTNISLFAQLNSVKNIMDAVCERKPEINFGFCYLFNGAYEVGRPKMLGGNPEKGKIIFEQYNASHSENLLSRVFFLEYYVIPNQDKELFEKVMNELDGKVIDFKNSMNYGHYVAYREVSNDRINIFNAIAVKRFEIIKKLKNKIIE